MKRTLTVLSLFVFLFSVGVASAETNISFKKSSDKKASATEDQKRKTEEERRQELDNSEWSVTVVQKGGDYTKDGNKDKLIFKNGKVSFTNLVSKGYGPSGYSLVVNPTTEGGTWETYAAGKKEGERLSVRGDWRGTIMNGTIVEQPDEKTSKTYYFTSQEKTTLAPPASSNAASEAAVPAAESSKSMSALVSKEEKTS